jgi:hypothetical protein
MGTVLRQCLMSDEPDKSPGARADERNEEGEE